eukprot:SM000106S13987  [mRNA]  locus=s106:380414:380868:+ [translate_table: standard]
MCTRHEAGQWYRIVLELLSALNMKELNSMVKFARRASACNASSVKVGGLRGRIKLQGGKTDIQKNEYRKALVAKTRALA